MNPPKVHEMWFIRLKRQKIRNDKFYRINKEFWVDLFPPKLYNFIRHFNRQNPGLGKYSDET